MSAVRVSGRDHGDSTGSWIASRFRMRDRTAALALLLRRRDDLPKQLGDPRHSIARNQEMGVDLSCPAPKCCPENP